MSGNDIYLVQRVKGEYHNDEGDFMLVDLPAGTQGRTKCIYEHGYLVHIDCLFQWGFNAIYLKRDEARMIHQKKESTS